MASILRGEIYWADLNPVIGSEQGGFRPILILSHNIFNDRSSTVIAVAITSQPQRAGFPLTLELSEILPSERKMSNNQGAKSPFVTRSASASAEEIVSIIDGLNEIISC